MGIVVTAYSPFCKGSEYENKIGANLNVFIDPLIKELAEKHKKTAGQIILNYLHDHLKVVPIPKTQSVERLKENFNFRDFKLTEEEV